MNFILQRYSNVAANGGSTQGLLLEKDPFRFWCHILEDEGRAVKIPGETRVWAGFYELKIWNDGKNPNQWVLDHRTKYNLNGDNWFKFPIEIVGIKDFLGVLFHAGIDQKHTDACPLTNDTIGNNTIDPSNQGGRSVQAMKRFYQYLYPHLEKGGKAFIEIRDEDFLLK